VFDKLVDLLVQFIELFQFWQVVPAYAQAVVLRLGKFHRLTDPGFHWKWPFCIEISHQVNVVPSTMAVGPQSLTTRDGTSIVIATVVTYRISDVKTYFLEIEGASQVIEDATYGLVAQFIMGRTWDELRGDTDMDNDLSIKVRRAAKKYGVEILTVQIADFTRSRSYRLMAPMHEHHAQ
jgi:regulator of protease activity HflC (stomatin/prohibitin superfamily)